MIDAGSVNEPERHVRDSTLGLECHIYGHAPVQADGRVDGHTLYFRARHSGWSFTLCPDEGIDPAGLAVGEVPGFVAGEVRVYALWGDYGTELEASYMSYAVAERLIRECAARFLAESKHAPGTAPDA